MKILRAQDHTRMPWKNGKGETIQIGIHPEDASLEDFDWRVSIATVDSDGPFSQFPGIDRTISILTGEGIVLSVADRDPARLTQNSAPFAFPADVTSSATLIGGAITDLNVMVRRTEFAANVQRLRIDDVLELRASAGETLLLCAEGQITLNGRQLASLDCARLEADDPSIMLHGQGIVFLIAIDPA